MVLPQVTERNWLQSVFCHRNLYSSHLNSWFCHKLQNATGCNLCFATETCIQVIYIDGFATSYRTQLVAICVLPQKPVFKSSELMVLPQVKLQNATGCNLCFATETCIQVISIHGFATSYRTQLVAICALPQKLVFKSSELMVLPEVTERNWLQSVFCHTNLYSSHLH